MIGEATMAKVPIRTAEDKRWAAESDVNVLTEADVIRKTPSRLRAAKVAAKRMVREEQQKVKAMNKVADGPSRQTKAKPKK
jgi:hypothetical protein